MKERNPFVEQTAKDYDMDYSVVYRIYRNNSLREFYAELENYIKCRAATK